VFVLPAGRRTIIGTTETDWPGPGGPARPPRPEDEIRAHRRDVDYLLETVNHAFPPANAQPSDVISTFAGLRPLIDRGLATQATTSREHAIWSDERGWLHVAGGKLTTMRSMAEEVVDRAIEMLRGRGFEGALQPCQTRLRPLPGAGKASIGSLALAPDIAAHLTETYGARVDQVLSLIASDTSLGRRLDPELPYLAAELVFAIRCDLACEVEDVLRRRVPLALFSRTHGLDVAEETAKLLARERGWSVERRAQSLLQYRTAVSASCMWQAD
jgi:glycerol-3-phosphate dehydrogenase